MTDPTLPKPVLSIEDQVQVAAGTHPARTFVDWLVLAVSVMWIAWRVLFS